jgi:hypothetical protein
LRRLLDEGHGPDAWYGADITAATADVDAAAALKRPAAGRHNIAEIALHHAYWTREVRGRLTGSTPEPFPLDGEDWFEVSSERAISWADIRTTLAHEQERLAKAVEAIASGAQTSPLGETERFDQVLGIAAHAAYHAGQIQLVKKLI